VKKLLCFSFLVSFLNVSIYAAEYRMHQIIVTKKDKTEKFHVKYGQFEKQFWFNWTLYQNEGLVVKTYYDRFRTQNMLYLNYVNQSLRIELKPRSGDMRWLPYIILKFVKFDQAKQEATFDLFLYDKKEQIDFSQETNSTKDSNKTKETPKG
jgi:hypothetical protein